MPKHFWKTIAIGLTIVVFVLCLYEFQSLPHVPVASADKYVHVLMHFSLYFAWWMAIQSTHWKSDLRLLLLLFGFGLGIEWLQEHCTERRGYDLYDVVANTSGALLALSLLTLYRYNRNKTQ